MPRSDEHGDDGWKMISNYSITKSWGGMHNFMASHGLKTYNPDDFDEAHQIIDAIKQADWGDMSPNQKAQVELKYSARK